MHTQRINSLDIDQQKLSAELAVLDGLKYQHAYSDFLCGGPWKSVMLWSAGGEQGDGFSVIAHPVRRTRARFEEGARLAA